MHLQAIPLALKLPDLFAQLIHPARQTAGPGGQQPSLAVQHAPNVRLVGLRRQFSRKSDRLQTIPLGNKPRFGRHQFVQLFADNGKIGAGRCIIQTQQQVACLDMVPIAHPYLGDNAAFLVFDCFDIAFHHKGPRGNNGAGNLHPGSPADKKGQKSTQEQACPP